MAKSDLENALAQQIELIGLPEPEREYRFHPTRRWRFDFAWPDSMLAAEVEGGVWSRGRHTRGKGFVADCIKYNQAVMMGWAIVRFTGSMIEDGTALNCLERLLVGDV